MRRNVKNDKVLRAITIGLATMIAVTSTPVTVLAGNENGQGDGETLDGDSDQTVETGEVQNDPQEGEGEEKKEEITIPEDVKNATSDLKQAAEQIEVQKDIPEGETQEKVVGGIEGAQTIINLYDDDTSIIVKRELPKVNEEDTTQYEEKSSDNIIEEISAELENEKALLNSTESGKSVGIYNDINEVQNAINAFYVENENLNNMISDLVETDENGNVVSFYGNAEKTVKYQIVPVAATGQYMIVKVDSEGRTELTNANSAFNTEEENSRAQSQSQNASDAVTAAQNANEAGDEETAKAFQKDAIAFIENAETEFGKDSTKFNEAVQFVKDSQEKLTAIEEQAAAVSEKLGKIKEEIKNLLEGDEDNKGGRATALNEQLKATEAKAEKLMNAAIAARKEVVDSQEKLTLLESIQTANTAVKAVAQKNIDENKSVTTGTYWKEARKLCYLLIEYYFLNGDLAIMDSEGNPMQIPDGGRLEIGADFEKVLSYSAPDFNGETTVDTDGNPIYNMTDVSDDYSINRDSQYSSAFEFVSLNADRSVKTRAYKMVDDDVTGQGWIYAGNEKKSDANNRVVVNIRDAQGRIIGTAYYNAKANADGSVYIYERELSEVETTEEGKQGQKHEDEVQSQDGRPASWSTADGSKTILVAEEPASTFHKINIDENDDSKGFYAIDTTTSTDVSSDADKAVKAPETTVNGNVKKEFAEVEGSSQTSYEKGTYTVVDSYNTKKKEEKTTASNSDDLKLKVAGYTGNNQNVKVQVGFLGADDIYFMGKKVIDLTYDVDPNNLSWFDELNAILPWSGGYKLNVSYDVPDLSSPKETHEEDGIYVIEKKNYIETTTRTEKPDMVTSAFYGGWVTKTKTVTIDLGILGKYTKEVEYPAWDDGRGRAEEELAKAIAELKSNETENVKYNIISSGVTSALFDVANAWHYYYIDYEIVSTSTDTVTKVVSRTQYAADKYTEYDYQEAKEYKPEVPEVIGYSEYKTKTISWQSDGDSQKVAKAKGKTDATQANILLTVNNKVTNRTDYSNLVSQLSTADDKVTYYTDLYNNVKSAREASDTLITMLNGFKYPSAATAAQGGDLVVSDLQPETFDYGFTADNFDTYFNGEGGILETLKAPIQLVLENLEIAEGRRKALAKKIEDARGIVNGIDLSRFNRGTIPGATNHRINDFSGGDDEDVTPSSTTPGTGTFVTYTTPDNEFTLIPVGYAGAGAGAQAGGRTVASNRAADRSGVLGVRADEETDTKKSTVKVINNIDNSEDKNKDKKNNAGEQKLVKVENNLVPLADTPFEEGAGMNWAWLLAAAAAAGAGAYGYGKHKKAVAANEEMKKYKK